MLKIAASLIGVGCLLVGAVAHFAPAGQLQEYADTGAQMCESAGFPAYPRDMGGERLPRPYELPAARSTGLVRQSDGSFRPVTLPPVRASSTVEDVGPAR